jgi:hypothetical protein
MQRKRYRVIIDFDVDILEITSEQIEKSNVERASRAEESGWTNVERTVPPEAELAPLRELQERLLENPELLDQWIKHEVFADMQAGSLNDFHYQFNEEEFLRVIVEKLSPRARHRLRESIARGEMIEELEPFWESFDSTPKSIRIAELTD